MTRELLFYHWNFGSVTYQHPLATTNPKLYSTLSQKARTQTNDKGHNPHHVQPENSPIVALFPALFSIRFTSTCHKKTVPLHLCTRHGARIQGNTPCTLSCQALTRNGEQIHSDNNDKRKRPLFVTSVSTQPRDAFLPWSPPSIALTPTHSEATDKTQAPNTPAGSSVSQPPQGNTCHRRL